MALSLNHRKKMYKVAVDVEKGRRRREDGMVEIRKNRREESLMKKRREGFLALHQLAMAAETPIEFKLESLPTIVSGIWNDDPSLQLQSTSQIKHLLSLKQTPPIDELVQAGVVPRLVEFLKKDGFPQLQLEAAWALTNIASGSSDHTMAVIDHGAIPLFTQLLSSPIDDVREQGVWALGNIAGDSPRCRDLVLRHGALMLLLAQFNEHARPSMLRHATWTLSNFCRGRPQPPFDQVKPSLPVFGRLIHSTDEEILVDVCWALYFLSNGTNEKIQAVIEASVVPRLVKLLLHTSQAVLIPALSTVGNIVTGDDSQTQCVIDFGGLACLLNLLTHHHKKSMKKEVCWTISNITAGNKRQIQAVIDAGLVGPLINLLQTAEFDIKKEAAWAISNAITCGSQVQIKHLVEQGCTKPLCDLLVCSDPKIINVCLEALSYILKVGEAEKDSGHTGGVNQYAQLIYDVDGLDKIESLQIHDNDEIYEKAVKILETYWLDEEEDEEALPSGNKEVTEVNLINVQPFSFGGNCEQFPVSGFNFN